MVPHGFDDPQRGVGPLRAVDRHRLGHQLAHAAAHAARESARELILIPEAANQRNQQANLARQINRLAPAIFKSEKSFL